MAGSWRLGTASMVLATAWTMAGRVAEAQLAPLPLNVAIYDYAALPPPVVERAKGVATPIYGRIGVSVTWLEESQVDAEVRTTPAACPDSPTPLIHLRLFGRSLQFTPACLVTLALRFQVARWRQCWSSASNTWRRARAWTSAICWASSWRTRLATCSSRRIRTPQGSWLPKVDLFLIEHGGLAFDPRQASMIRARIGSMPRSEQGPCRA